MIRTLVFAVLLAGLLVGCDDESAATTAAQTAPTPAETAPPSSPAPAGATVTPAPGMPSQNLTVTIRAERITPTRLMLPLDVPVHIGIQNEGQEPCLFFLGDYLRGLLLPGGGAGEVNFVAPASSGSDRGDVSIEMGCVGDSRRQGQVTTIAGGGPAQLRGAVSLSPPQTGAQRIAVTVTADGIEPSTVRLPLDTPVRLEVTNGAEPCLFYFGDYLRGLLIPGDSEGVAGFTAPARSGSARGAEDEVTMGCVGDDQRQGTVVIEP